jgi:hypothetical protein
MTKYENYDWNELPGDVKKAAEQLGYDKRKWDKNIKVPADDKDWKDLSAKEQEAALKLGYTQKTWDEGSDDESESESESESE